MSDKLIWVMDAGNTNIKSGLFLGEKLLHTWRLTTDGDRTADEYGILMMQMFQIHRISLDQIEGIIISSVVPSVNFNLDRMCRKHFGHTPLFVGPGIKTGLNIRIDNPKELGADITANAVAAWHHCHSAAVVIDFGTATTFFALSGKCELLGGAIFPGVKVASEALITHTSQLPRFELQRPESSIGRNTIHSPAGGHDLRLQGCGGVHRRAAQAGTGRAQRPGVRHRRHVHPDEQSDRHHHRCAQLPDPGGLAADLREEPPRVRGANGGKDEEPDVGLSGDGQYRLGRGAVLAQNAAVIAHRDEMTFTIKKALVRSLDKARNTPLGPEVFTTRPEEVVADPQIQIVVELLGGLHPARELMLQALEHGKTVVTANKAVLATYWHEFEAAARQSGAGLYYEASVCGGIPIINVLTRSMQANRIGSMMGIINGTTNYILTKMSEEGGLRRCAGRGPAPGAGRA